MINQTNVIKWIRFHSGEIMRHAEQNNPNALNLVNAYMTYKETQDLSLIDKLVNLVNSCLNDSTIIILE